MEEFDDNNLLFALEEVKHNKRFLENASYELINNQDIVWQATYHYSPALQYASKELLNNKTFILSLLEDIDGWLIQYASEEIKSDPTIAIFSLNHGGRLQNLSESLYDNKNVILAAINNLEQHKTILTKMDKNLYYNFDIMLPIITQNPHLLSMDLGAEFNLLKHNKQFFIEAININPEVFNHASHFIKKDKDVLYEALKTRDAELFVIPKSIRKELGDKPLQFLKSYFMEHKKKEFNKPFRL